MNTRQLIQLKRSEILRLAEKHGAYNLRLFGSVARGTAGPGSDLDLLVEVGAHRTPFFPGGLIADLEDLLGCKVEVVTDDALHELMRDQILQEAVPL